MNSPAPQFTMHAAHHLAPDGSVVESARLLATAVAAQARNGSRVKIEFQGLRGATTSYFNMLLRDLRESLGPSIVEERLEFAFASPLQSELFERSRRAVSSDAPN